MSDWPTYPVSISGQSVSFQSGSVILTQSTSGETTRISGLNVIAEVGSGLYIINNSGVNVITQSGVAIVAGSGQLYVRAQVLGSVAIASGPFVNIGSGIGVLTQSQSGTGVTVQSGIYVNIGSGTGVKVDGQVSVTSLSSILSYIGKAADPLYIASGTEVIIDAISVSGQGVIVSTSGNSFPSIGGQFRPVDVLLASGAAAVVSLANDGDLRVKAVAQSGQAMAVTFSGQLAFSSGLAVIIGSGVGVVVDRAKLSGISVVNTASSPLYVTNTMSSPIYIASGVTIAGSITTSVASGLYIISDSGVRVVVQSGTTVLFQSASGEGLRLSGLGVIGSLTVNISGQPVTATASSPLYVVNSQSSPLFIASGANIAGNLSTTINSGLYVTAVVSGQTSQMISGQALYVQMSGVTGNLSGINVVGNFSTTVNSGLNVIVQSGLGVVGNIAVGSGLYIVMSGQGVTIQSISGLYVQFLSGTVVTQSGGFWPSLGVGGQYSPALPTIASGGPAIFMQDVNARLIVTASGQGVVTNLAGNSGQWVNIGNSLLSSGIGVLVNKPTLSGLGVLVATSGSLFPLVGGQFRPVDVLLASGATTVVSLANDGDLRVKAVAQSGYAVAVTFSGQLAFSSGLAVNIGSGVGVIIGNMSGQYVLSTASSPLYVTNTMSSPLYVASGIFVAVAVSGVTAQMASGQALYVQMSGVNIPATVRVNGYTPITAASAGAQLSSGIIVGVNVRAFVSNAGMLLIGGDSAAGGTRPWYVSNSSYNGYPLFAGEVLSLSIQNLNEVYVCAATSGDKVHFIAVN